MQNGKVLNYEVFPNANKRSDLKIIKRSTYSMLESLGIHKDVLLGICLSLPGTVDYYNTRLVSVNKKYNWGVGFDFIAWAKKEFEGIPLVIENDARLALLGEATYGVAKGYDNVVVMTFGTGIGSGAMIEGKILRGAHNTAGSLGGHMVVDYDGFPCNCGNQGCIEGQIGSWRLPDFIKKQNGFFDKDMNADITDYRTLCLRVEEGDSFAKRCFKRITRLWGVGLVNLIHAYDPEVCVLTGGVLKSAHIILEPVRRYVKKNAWVYWGEIPVLASEQVDSSTVMGGEALIKRHLTLPAFY